MNYQDGKSPPPGGADRNPNDAKKPFITIVAPTRGRGSKQGKPRRDRERLVVAPTRGRGSKPSAPAAFPAWRRRPHQGARIETTRSPSWGCPRLVAPTRGRGSKQRSRHRGRMAKGRPHPGARIETVLIRCAVAVSDGRPHPGARIETSALRHRGACDLVAPTRGRGSKPHQP